MKLFSLMVVAVSLSGISCERHEFTGEHGTRQLQDHAAGHANAMHDEEKMEH